MSVESSRSVWQNSKARLASRLVLLALADCTNGSGVCWPAIRTICQMTLLSERAVHGAVAELIEIGEVSCTRNGGPHGSNLYRINVQPAPEPPQTLHPSLPADFAPPQTLHPANGAVKGCILRQPGVHSTTETPANSAPNPPRTVKEPSGNHKEPSAEGLAFADWFRALLPESLKLTATWRDAWADVFDKLIRLDGRDPVAIRKVCVWARNDDFWQSNFMSPAKLREKDKSGVNYFDKFMAASTRNEYAKLPESVRAVQEGRHHGGPKHVNTTRVPDEI